MTEKERKQKTETEMMNIYVGVMQMIERISEMTPETFQTRVLQNLLGAAYSQKELHRRGIEWEKSRVKGEPEPFIKCGREADKLNWNLVGFIAEEFNYLCLCKRKDRQRPEQEWFLTNWDHIDGNFYNRYDYDSYETAKKAWTNRINQ